MLEDNTSNNAETAQQLSIDNLPEKFSLENRYFFFEKIGKGGFATVYKVWDSDADRYKALKFIHREYYDNKNMIRDLKKETDNLMNIQSKHVVRIWDIHLQGELKYLDLEYIDGGDLADLMLSFLDKRMPERRVFKIAEQIAIGMQDIHRERIIHKDLKPQNIMLDAKGCVKIMDLGLSEVYNSMQTRLEETKRNGTPGYMSPEQLIGKDVGRESDIWSFGVVLYEMLSGKLLYPGFTFDDVLMQIKEKGFEPIADISSLMNELMKKCLQYNYTERFRTFAEVESFLHEMMTSAVGTPIEIVETSNDPVVEPEADCSDESQPDEKPEKQETPPPKKKRTMPRSTRKLLIWAGIIALILIAIFTFDQINQRSYIKEQITKASEYLKNEDFNLAKSAYEQVLKLFPENSEAKAGLDKILEKLSLRDKSVGLHNLTYVKGGTFLMGSEKGDDDEKPTHNVTLSSYYIGKYEITIAEVLDIYNWAKENDLIQITSSMVINTMGEKKELLNLFGDDSSIYWNETELDFKDTEFAESSRCPCTKITWHGAVAYCNFLSLKEELIPCYDFYDWSIEVEVAGYRLPSEAEWEYASRGGKKSGNYTYAGSNIISKIAEFRGNNNVKVEPVGGKSPNELGLYDMSGNVWEWCQDRYGSYTSDPVTNPLGSEKGIYRVERGGSWAHHAYYCRTSVRAFDEPVDSHLILGFRILKPVS